MKKFVAITAVTGLALTVSMSLTVAAEGMIGKRVEAALVNVCKSVKSDSVFQLKQSLKDANLDVYTINQKLVCNSENVHAFAVTHNANRTAAILQKSRVQIQDLAYNGEKYQVFID